MTRRFIFCYIFFFQLGAFSGLYRTLHVWGWLSLLIVWFLSVFPLLGFCHSLQRCATSTWLCTIFLFFGVFCQAPRIRHCSHVPTPCTGGGGGQSPSVATCHHWPHGRRHRAATPRGHGFCLATAWGIIAQEKTRQTVFFGKTQSSTFAQPEALVFIRKQNLARFKLASTFKVKFRNRTSTFIYVELSIGKAAKC